MTSDTVTVLFTDLAGSTALAAGLGPERADRVRRRHFGSLDEAIAASGGAVVKNVGDGYMAVFRSAADAVQAAVAAQQAVDRDNRNGTARLSMRVGVAAGDATAEAGDWFGRPVIEAARLCADCEPGQILVGEAVRWLAGGRGGHTYRGLGTRSLKGLSEPVPVCEVLWEPSPATPALPLPARVTPVSAAFVGRRRERAELDEALAAVRAGRPRLVAIGGEPGVGKTTLASDLARRAYDDGVAVLWGHCPEQALTPYQPFVEALDDAVAGDADAVLGLDARHAGDLVRLLPGIAAKRPGLPPPVRTESDTERLALFTAVVAFLRRLDHGRGLVLVLDDLHWADEPTLLLLRHVMEAPGDLRLLVVGTYRDTELGRTHPLVDVLADLRRTTMVERVTVAGLSHDEVVDFLESRAGHTMDAAGTELAVALHRETEGNPFFIEEIVRHMVEAGLLVESGGRWTSDRPVRQLPIPEGVKDVVGRRLARLPGDTDRLLAVAAVIGREFDLALLEAVTERASNDLLDAVEAAVTAALVVELERPGAFAFSHAIVRETLYSELSTTRRVRLHAKVADAIESSGRRDGAALAQLAHHFGEAAAAGSATKAAVYSVEASKAAIAALAYEDALVHALHGLAAIEEGNEPRLEYDLLLCKAVASHRLGRMGEARNTYRAAADIAQAQGWAYEWADAAWREANTASRIVGDDAEQVARFEATLAALPEDDHPVRAKVMGGLAAALLFADPFGRGRRLVDDALAMARRVEDPDALPFTLWIALQYAAASPDLDWRRGMVDEAVTLAARIGNVTGEWQCLALAGGIAIEAGEPDALRLVEDRLTELERSHSIPVLGLGKRHWEFSAALSRGEIDHAAELSRQTHELAVNAQYQADGLFLAVREAAMAREQGAMGDALPFLEAVAETFAAITAWRAMLAFAYAETGDLAAARCTFDELAAPGLDPLVMSPAAWTFGAVAMADVAADLSDAVAAEALERQLLGHAGLVVAVAYGIDVWGAVDRYLGRLAHVQGHLDVAVDRLESGLALEKHLGLRPWAVRSRSNLAAALADRAASGDVDRATVLLDDAISEAATLPNRAMEERVRGQRAILA